MKGCLRDSVGHLTVCSASRVLRHLEVKIIRPFGAQLQIVSVWTRVCMGFTLMRRGACPGSFDYER
jgi:hypothetical protein